MMTSQESVENDNFYRFYERIGFTVMFQKPIISSVSCEFNWETDWTIKGKPWWEVLGAQAIDYDTMCYLTVRKAHNGNTVFRVHKIGGQYGWFENKESAIKFLQQLMREFK